MPIYRFPMDPNLRKLWVLATKRDSYVPSNTAVLCEKHFGADNYEINVHGNRVLKRGAIPSIYNFPAHLTKVVKKRKLIKRTLNVNQEGKFLVPILYILYCIFLI